MAYLQQSAVIKGLSLGVFPWAYGCGVSGFQRTCRAYKNVSSVVKFERKPIMDLDTKTGLDLQRRSRLHI
jgi:hypothetical protein